MTPDPEIGPKRQRWEASALTSAPSNGISRGKPLGHQIGTESRSADFRLHHNPPSASFKRQMYYILTPYSIEKESCTGG